MPDYLGIARRALRARETSLPPALEGVLKGVAVELWCNSADQLFIVADEDDAEKLGAPRGVVYTAAEVRRIIRISDPSTVREMHEWKRKFNGVIQETDR